MFGKFFSKKPISSQTSESQGTQQESIQSPTEENRENEMAIETLIIEALKTYQSSNFPQGIYIVCQQLALNYDKAKNTVDVEVTLPFPCQGELEALADTLSTKYKVSIHFHITLNITSVRQHDIKNVANIIAIASGKGGVGKSTTAVNLAYALMAEGARVGILDADIYGPSIPAMLGLHNAKPSSIDGKLMTPLNAKGLQAMSIGFLVDDTEATVWRGPMASSAFNQLLNETSWEALDYLIIDMPPGTGDIQLTLAQKVPVAAAVIVTTPQDIALADAVKGLVMFDKVSVPVLGVIENMSYHQCENCGHHAHIFGEGGGEDIAADYDIALLGQLPLNISIRQDADLGQSEIIENSAGEIAQLYRKIARNMAGQLFLQLDARSPLTPTVNLVDE